MFANVIGKMPIVTGSPKPKEPWEQKHFYGAAGSALQFLEFI